MQSHNSTCWPAAEDLLCTERDERFPRVTHIRPCNLSIDVSRHVPAAVLLLQLSFTGGQPLLQAGALLLELLRQRQGFLQVLLALCHLERLKTGQCVR